jgi:serine protease Do
MLKIARLTMVLALLAGGMSSSFAQEAASGNAEAPPAQQSVLLLPNFAQLVNRQGPTVVNVRVFKAERPQATEPNKAPQARSLRPPVEAGVGSGFIVTSSGLILTNRHVVADAERVRVRFVDKSELPAVVVGVDPLTDVAVLKVEAQNLPVVVPGDSSRLQVGQWVLAIGAPMGLERTATQGIISALGRTLPDDSYVPFIQTDVPINPGNSGGPLFDLEGRVIGINSQIMSNSGGYMGLSFAIPINTAMAVAKQIVERGHASHGWLGISTQELTLELAQAYGLKAPRGALINDLNPQGPGYKAGLQTGDIILAVGNIGIVDSADLPPIIGACQPGSEQELVLLRDGQVIRVKVRVGELGQEGATAKRAQALTRIDRLGLKVSDLDRATKEVFAIANGVLVESAEEGPAAIAGVQAGDILLKLGARPVDSAAHLHQLVSRLPAGSYPLLVRRQNNPVFVTVVLSGAK